jgi:hypothetical protein
LIVKALLWTVFGGVASVFSQIIGGAMIGYGLAFANGFCEKKSVWFRYVLAALAGSVLACLYDQQSVTGYLVGAVTVATASFVAYRVMNGKGTLTSAYIAGTVSTLLLMAIDFVPVMLQGTTPLAAVSGTYDSIMAAVQQTADISSLAALGQMKTLVLNLWPLTYAALGFSSVVGAHLGARMGVQPDSKLRQSAWQITSFKAPRWSVVALVASGSLLALSFGLSGSVQDVFRIVGLNALMLVRFIFAFQGYSILVWFLQKFRIGCILRVVILFAAIDLEMSFFVLSVVGLIDVWANFRGNGNKDPGSPPNPTLPTT